MSVSLEMEAFKTPEGEIAVALGVENNSETEVRIGSSMSQLYEIVAHSETVDFYGDSHGYMAAPHHLTVPSGKSKVFIRTFSSTHPAEDIEHMERSEVLFNVLDETVTEVVTIDAEVLIRTDGIENLTDSVEFVPSDLSEKSVSEVIEALVSLPQTDNELQMG